MSNLYKFTQKEDGLYYGEAEVDLIDSPAFIQEYKNKVTFWGTGYDEINLSHEVRNIKPIKLNEILNRFKIGNKIKLGGNTCYIIQALEINLLESEYRAKKINPYNYVLTVYVYPADLEDLKDRRFININMDYGDEEEAEENELDKIFN